MKILHRTPNRIGRIIEWINGRLTKGFVETRNAIIRVRGRLTSVEAVSNERGDVPGWVLVVLMTTGLVTAIWMIAAPRLTAILRNSLDSMNGIR